MKTFTSKSGLTLLEIMISIAIIVVIASIVISTAVRVETHAKEHLMENTFALINAALAEFKESGFKYDPLILSWWGITANDEREFYLGLDFPVDCTDYIVEDNLKYQALMFELALAFGSRQVFVSGGAVHQDEQSACEGMYFVLRRVPECRRILDKIDDSLITNSDPNIVALEIEINNEIYPLNRIIDPWGRTLRYDYYANEKEEPSFSFAKREKSKRTFPLLISAGPDGEFGTTDDMKSRKR